MYALEGYHLAEDVAQDAFLAAYQRLDQIIDPKAFPGWFRQIVRRRGYAQARDRQVPVEPLELALNVPSTDPSPYALVERIEQEAIVRHAIETLPAHEQIVTTLYYLEGCSQQEIVAMLDIPLAAVKKRPQRARERLRPRLRGIDLFGFHTEGPGEYRRLVGDPYCRPSAECLIQYGTGVDVRPVLDQRRMPDPVRDGHQRPTGPERRPPRPAHLKVKMIRTMRRLRDIGNTAIVVEHDEATIRTADHVIEVGPGPGVHGGRIVAEGPIDRVIKNPGSLTGQYLRGIRKIELPKKRRRRNGRCLTVRGARENNLRNLNKESSRPGRRSSRMWKLGPEGGHKGGKLLAQGTPEKVAGIKRSHTGRFLKRYL